MIASLWFSPDTVPVLAAALTADIGRHLIEEPDSEQGPIHVEWEVDATCVFLEFTEGRIYDYAGGPAKISLAADEAHILADALMRVSGVAA